MILEFDTKEENNHAARGNIAPTIEGVALEEEDDVLEELLQDIEDIIVVVINGVNVDLMDKEGDYDTNEDQTN